MRWFSITIVGTVAVVICGGLAVLIRAWWLRRNGQHPLEAHSPRVTGVGFVVFGSMALALFAGFWVNALAPTSFVGQLLHSDLGLGIFMATLIAIAAAVIAVLDGLGYPSTKKHGDAA